MATRAAASAQATFRSVLHQPALRQVQRPKRPETVQRILSTAERIFAERGLAGARIDEIAAEARVNKALLYYYFRSKQQLHRCVLERLFELLLASVGHERSAKTSPRERLLGYVNGYFDFVAQHPNYPRLVQREMMDGGRHMPWMVNTYFRPLHAMLARAIDRGIAAGEFRRVDSRQTVTTLIAMTTFYFAAAPLLTELWRADALQPRAVEQRRRAILDFLEHGLFPGGKRPR